MSFSVRCAAALTLLVFGLAAVGCGGTVIDEVSAEETIQASLEKSQHEKIKSVDCPSELELDPGTTFTCVVERSNGEQAIVTMKIRNKDADLDIVGLKPKN